MEQIREISAVCPQFNVQFEFLTLKENLRTFAKIKGIPNNDIENEVRIYLYGKYFCSASLYSLSIFFVKQVHGKGLLPYLLFCFVFEVYSA